MIKHTRYFILIGILLALTGVIIGAFGAHLLKNAFSADQQRWFETGVNYHMIHALGLILCGLASFILGPAKFFSWACLSLLTGVIVFSGSLYVMAITNQTWLGAVTPLGGIAFIAGWSLFALAVINSSGSTTEVYSDKR